jgi:hypothetical protein
MRISSKLWIRTRTDLEERTMILKYVGALFASSVLLFSCLKQTVSQDEKLVFVPASEMAQYGASLPEEYSQYEKYTKKMYYDSTFELQYEYTVPESVDSDLRFLIETYSFENKNSDVFVNDIVTKGITSTIYNANGISLSEKSDSFEWGRKSAVYDILSKNKLLVGSRFVASSEKMNFSFTIIGMHIAQKEIWSELLKSKLDRAKGFTIGLYSLNAKQ